MTLHLESRVTTWNRAKCVSWRSGLPRTGTWLSRMAL